MIADLYVTPMHRQLLWRNSFTFCVIAVGNINIRTEHVVIANLNMTAGINHQIPIEVVSAANAYSDSVEWFINRPKPAALGEGVVATNFDLAQPAAAATTFHPIVTALFHSQKAVNSQA
jgi:hypothetical protein